jgi:CheY-like chemotaxis protein
VSKIRFTWCVCASLPIPWPVCESRNLTHALTVLSCSRALVLAQMLLDWELGDMTGLEVVEKLREGYPWLQDLRIIMVSGNTPDEQTMATLGALGVDDYWEKPVSAKQLQDLLRECTAATTGAAPDATSAASTSSAASAAAADAKPPS